MTDEESEISNLWTVSGREYQAVYNGFVPGAVQCIDRDHVLDQVPASIKGQALIKTAGNDRMFEEDKP